MRVRSVARSFGRKLLAAAAMPHEVNGPSRSSAPQGNRRAVPEGWMGDVYMIVVIIERDCVVRPLRCWWA
jgi:hypothetical protein